MSIGEYRKVTFYHPQENEELKQTRYLKKTFGKSQKAFNRALELIALLYGKKKNKRGFIELYSVDMAKKFGGTVSWTRLVNALVKGKWIIKSKKYRPSIFGKARCQGYKLTDKARNLTFSEEVREIWVDMSGPQLEGVTIDTEAALEALAAMNLPPQSKAFFRREIELFTANYKIGPQTGRLFTSSNRLNEPLRQFVRIDGQTVAEIDVKNCQPLLLATLYQTQSEESKKFCALVESGGFYESIADYLKLSRSKAKEEFTVWLGGEVKPMISGYFFKFWPELGLECGKIRAGGRKALCHDLQKKESHAVVDEFPKRFGGSSVSIHDGILIPETQKERAHEILLEIFRDFYGLRPSLDLKTRLQSHCSPIYVREHQACNDPCPDA
jgi:hypothetical protein